MDQDLPQAPQITPQIRDGDNEIDILSSLFLVSIVSLVDLYEGAMPALFCVAALLAKCKTNPMTGSAFMHKAGEFSRVKMAIDFLVEFHQSRKNYSPLENELLSRYNGGRRRDDQLVLCSPRENEKVKTFSWTTISLLFKFLFRMRKHCKQAKKDAVVPSSRPPISKNWQKGEYFGGGSLGALYNAFAGQNHGRRRDNQLMICSNHQEDKRLKAFNRWRTISRLFEFLYRVRKCCDETKKDHPVSSSKQPISMDWQKVEYFGDGPSGTDYEAFTEHCHEIRRSRRRGNPLLLSYPLSMSDDDGENEDAKQFSKWKTIYLLFQFLYKIRKRCKEAKKNHAGSPPRPSIIKNWQMGEKLGGGAFGSVYEAFAENGFFFALKEVSLDAEDRKHHDKISHAEQEINLLSQFQHKNIVRYLGSQKDDSKFYIYLELVPQGSLAKLYKRYKLSDSQVSEYTWQILCGLVYLHNHGVIHRDVKCSNVLVDTDGSVKLADFGLAKVTKLNDIKSLLKGTTRWMAPEVVNPKNHAGYGCAADIWSLGCTVLEMLTRKYPYSDLEDFAALYRIGQGVPPSIPNTLSKDSRDFILKCLRANPEDRPTAAQLLEDPFVNNNNLPSTSSTPPR